MKLKKNPYYNKIVTGIKPSFQDWSEHLIHSHEARPGLSSEAFGHLKTVDGLSSYELICNKLVAGKPHRILDLGCGDGIFLNVLQSASYLFDEFVGVDMSIAEVDRANQFFKQVKNAKFVCSVADALPFASNHFDCVVSHMALMLMQPIDLVIDEIYRTLKPGGQFIAVVSNASSSVGMFKEAIALVNGFLSDQFPILKAHRALDGRTASDDGYRSLLGREEKFSVASIEHFSLSVDTSPKDLWGHFNLQYSTSLLDSFLREQLRSKFFSELELEDKASVHFEIPMRLIIANKMG